VTPVIFSVSTTEFNIDLPSGACSCGMTKVAPSAYAPITNVFVVMLENHSFDHVLAFSGIPNLIAATTSNSNSYGNETYQVIGGAPLAMPTDPGHEFLDVVEQLGGEGAVWTPGETYPRIDNSGFVANYATSTTEGPPPGAQDYQLIMNCLATRVQMPISYQLATQFAVCDQWFSSMPGPTWPNRFFVHGASSSGLDDSPSSDLVMGWDESGFEYPHGSIFKALSNAGIGFRLYHDYNPNGYLSLYSAHPEDGTNAGATPLTAALADISGVGDYSLLDFAGDLQGPYPYAYTFIEPHYGDIDLLTPEDSTFQGGSSEHPMDDTWGGENLLQNIYWAIRNSPYWNTSLLIITFDEHGGFYDSFAPPSATPPGDDPPYGYSQHGFKFDQYGVRVPAIIVSPLIPAGTVDHTVYDHSSVPKTIEQLFGLGPLTQRDEQANDLLHLLSLSVPRPECPGKLELPPPPAQAARRQVTEAERAFSDAQPLPPKGFFWGTLYVMKKTEFELSGKTPAEVAAIEAKFESIRTRGDARAYIDSVMQKVATAKQQRNLAGLAQ